MSKQRIIQGDALDVMRGLPDDEIDCIVTSPPYWALRDYGIAEQIGLEGYFQDYIAKLCDIFDEAKRILKPTGTCWVNLGDTYGTRSETACGKANRPRIVARNITGAGKKMVKPV